MRSEETYPVSLISIECNSKLNRDLSCDIPKFKRWLLKINSKKKNASILLSISKKSLKKKSTRDHFADITFTKKLF